jgi:hypothetical protein
MAGIPLKQSIPGTITLEHHPTDGAVVGRWHSFHTGRYREAVEAHIAATGQVRARTSIIDVSSDPGVPRQEDLVWTEQVAKQLMRKAGVTAVINVLGDAVLVKMGARRWSKGATDAGLTSYDCGTLKDALALARKLALGKAA